MSKEKCPHDHVSSFENEYIEYSYKRHPSGRFKLYDKTSHSSEVDTVECRDCGERFHSGWLWDQVDP